MTKVVVSTCGFINCLKTTLKLQSIQNLKEKGGFFMKWSLISIMGGWLVPSWGQGSSFL
jgi:hypothetical protein